MKRILLIILFLPVITKAQIITTFAGNGSTGYSGDGGQATAAQFGQTVGVAVDTAGIVYVTDVTNNVIRKVNAMGVITTFAGTGTAGYSGDGGPASAAELNGPSNVGVDNAGNVYIIDYLNNVVRKVNTSGIITHFSGNGTQGYSGDGGPATNAAFYSPVGITFDNSGNVYLADGGNNVIRKINSTGIVTTFAGIGTAGYNGDGMPATAAQLNNVTMVAWNVKNNSLYIADNLNHRIRVVNPSGIISTLAGNGTAGDSGDGGAPAAATINGPWGISIDTAGTIFFADYNNNRIRQIKNNIISAFAGNGVDGFGGDGGNAVLAQLSLPIGTAVDRKGNLYIGDMNNNRYRKVHTHSTTSATSLNMPVNEITLFPNPVTNELNITATDKITNLTITNLIGQTVYAHHCSSSHIQVDVSGFAKGVYFVKINSSDIRKFIKK